MYCPPLTICQTHIFIQVTVTVDTGRELGISIRGGMEHGLGIYISQVEDCSVAKEYGLKVCMYSLTESLQKAQCIYLWGSLLAAAKLM